MRKFFWKLAYMRQMMKRSKCGLRCAWDSACASASTEEWHELSGADAADEEMSCWSD